MAEKKPLTIRAAFMAGFSACLVMLGVPIGGYEMYQLAAEKQADSLHVADSLARIEAEANAAKDTLLDKALPERIAFRTESGETVVIIDKESVESGVTVEFIDTVDDKEVVYKMDDLIKDTLPATVEIDNPSIRIDSLVVGDTVTVKIEVNNLMRAKRVLAMVNPPPGSNDGYCLLVDTKKHPDKWIPVPAEIE